MKSKATLVTMAPCRARPIPPTWPLACVVALALASSACSKADGGPAGSGFDLRVAALELAGVNGVVYGVRVLTADGQTVWERDDLDSVLYGDGRGAISYVGPCDATPSSNPHVIELTLLEMRSGPETIIPADTYQNPAPVGDPIVVNATCVENADVPVTINLTIMRDAVQGFFDVAVNFEDIFCSAKFDCKRDGQPIDLLHNAEGARDTTVILGFACTAGGDGDGGGEPTWMHLSNVIVQCVDAADQPVTLTLSPAGPEGNNGGVPPLFYQLGIYRGDEQLEPYDKCYWNMAFGIELGATSGLTDCRLLAQGTASHESFGPDGTTPPETVYPYVQWDIDLTDANGALVCDVHPLGGTGDAAGVSTEYTGWSGTSFTHEWECGGDTEVIDNELACAGLTELGTDVAFVPQPSGLTVRFGAAVDPTYYALPAGYTFGAQTRCCVNPCCSQ